MQKYWGQYSNKLNELIDKKAIETVALKVDKINGDLRTAFNILRNTIMKKIEYLKDQDNSDAKDSGRESESSLLQIRINDINNVIS